MLARIRKSQESEAGFTLIELLVVIIIIGILAAIAIPTFLNQRKKGWKSAMKSDISNAVLAEESHATDNNGNYTALVSDLTTQGFHATPNVTLTLTANGSTSYTVAAVNSSLANCTITFDSTLGTQSEAGTGC